LWHATQFAKYTPRPLAALGLATVFDVSSPQLKRIMALTKKIPQNLLGLTMALLRPVRPFTRTGSYTQGHLPMV
jgi:hypothetical protein